MKIAYFDCFAGASGDMILGALLDAGLPLEALQGELHQLSLKGFQLSAWKERRGALQGTRIRFDLEDTPPVTRRLADILDLIAASALPEAVKEGATRVFRRLAQAEAKVHGLPLDKITFHEVGAIDSILDIVGAIVGLHRLGIEEVYASTLPLGRGSVQTAHGVLPVPAPATLELLAVAKVPVQPGLPGEGECLTPTAAAILTTVARFEEPAMVLEGVGYGLGSRETPGLPNALRLCLGEKAAPSWQEGLILVETNIDDMNPELYGYVLERLFDQGARDVWFTPIQMKKNRPATMLSVLVSPKEEKQVVETLLRETSTLGVRCLPLRRHEAGRESLEFESSLGRAAVKVKRLGQAVLGIAPEYEACRLLALRHSLPLQEVYRLVEEEARQQLLSSGEG